MALGDELAPATDLVGGAVGKALSYAWILFPLVIILFVVGAWWVIRTFKKKNSQWTHTLEIKRVGQDNKLLPEVSTHRMRRFPLIKRAEVFELENPVLGIYLFPELEQYAGKNHYKIILDNNNRIYTNMGETFVRDKSSVNVSAKHSEIDIGRSKMKADWEKVHQVAKRVEWATIAKYAFLVILVVVTFILLIQGISAWGNAQETQAKQAQSEAIAFQNLAEAMLTVQATVNTQKLEIQILLEQLYGTENIQSIINEPVTIGGINGTK